VLGPECNYGPAWALLRTFRWHKQLAGAPSGGGYPARHSGRRRLAGSSIAPD